MRSLQQIFADLPTTPESGLKPEAVADSRTKFGANRLTPLPREPLWKKFVGKFDEPIIKILLAAALLSMFVDLFQAPGVNPWIPGGALLAVMGLILTAFILRVKQWIPALLFASALVLFFVGSLGAGHTSIEGLAV